jgi:rhamnose transport system permease protein
MSGRRQRAWLRAGLTGRLGRWEVILAGLVLATLAFAASWTPGFMTVANVSNSLSIMSEKALMVLPLTLLIVAREIDISVASIGALAAVAAGVALRAGAGVLPAVAVALAVGLVCGTVNGALVTVMRLPSLVVTLGTLALFRGMCYVLLGGTPVTAIPPALMAFGTSNVPGTPLPYNMLPFLVLAPLTALLLHRLPVGRQILFVGGGPEVALYSGVRTQRLRFGLFAGSGLVAAIAGIISIGQTSQASPDTLLGYELDAIAVVFLGGVCVFGGRGRVAGVLWALTLVTSLRSVLLLHSVSAYAQGTAIGLLLILSLLTANLARALSRRLRRPPAPEPAEAPAHVPAPAPPGAST